MQYPTQETLFKELHYGTDIISSSVTIDRCLWLRLYIRSHSTTRWPIPQILVGVANIVFGGCGQK